MASKEYVKHFFKGFTYIVCTTLSPGGLSLVSNFQKRGPEFFGKEGVTFLAGGGGITVVT